MEMTILTAGMAGSLLGILFAVVANLFVLPHVLRAQQEGFVMGRKTVLTSENKEKVALMTRFMYRIPMPILFAFVGWFAGLKVIGV